MPIRYAGNDNRITYGKTPIKSIMQGETAVYGEDVFAKQPLFTYSETQDSVTITGLTDLGKTRKNIIIPSEHNGKAVTAISSTAFNNETNITSVVIPDSVTSIALGAFSGCASLESLTVADGNTVYHSAGNCIIETATKTLVVGCKSSVIPDDGSVTNIGERAFWNCNALTLITIPDSVTSIGDHAFDNCTALTSIVIPDSVTNIGEYAFRGCTSLTSVTIGNGVTSIGYNAFSDCTSLTSVIIPDSVTNIGGWAFYECDSLTSVTIGDGVTSIGNNAFYGCTSLTSIVIPSSVTSIGSYAFEGCYNLQYNEYDNALYLGNDENPYLVLIKAKDETITSVDINASTKVICGSAFYGCTSLTSIVIPNSVTTIGNDAFYGCIYLTSIVIPDSVTSIEEQAFQYCYSLSSVTFTGTITQWNAITKGLRWNSSCPFTEVKCSDGTVSV